MVWDEGVVATTLQGGYGRGEPPAGSVPMVLTCAQHVTSYIAKFFLGAVRPGHPGNGMLGYVDEPLTAIGDLT